jgi:drug/metabolite transporter (DMT)-like permease
MAERTVLKESRVPGTAKLALLLACFLWAISFIAVKDALETVPPLTVVSFRLIISALCFLIWLFFRPQPFRIRNPRWMGKLFILSLLGTGLHYGLQTMGIGYTTATNASVYAATGPIAITIVAAVFLGEKITWKKTAGIGCALIGVLIVMGIENILSFRLKGGVLGDLLVFLSIFMWALFTVFGKDMTRQMSALELTTAVTVMGAIYMIVPGVMEMNRVSLSLAAIPLKAWIAIGFLGITCSFLATLLYFFALEKTESQKVGVYLYTIPPMTAIFASLYLKETIHINLLVGTLAVLFGVYLTGKG